MTEQESKVLKDIIAMITQRKNSAEMKEMMASQTDDAHRYGTEAWTLTQVLNDIESILYIHEKHHRELDAQEEIDRIDDLEWHSYYSDDDE